MDNMESNDRFTFPIYFLNTFWTCVCHAKEMKMAWNANVWAPLDPASIQRDICIFISLSFGTIQYEWVLKVNSFEIQESGKRKNSELRIYIYVRWYFEHIEFFIFLNSKWKPVTQIHFTW